MNALVVVHLVCSHAVIMSVVENLVKLFGSGVCVFTHIKLRGGLNG